MNLKNAIFLTIMLSQTAPLWSMENDEYQEKFTKIKEKIECITKNINVEENAKKVIIIGPTGTGKGSLINYLAEKKLIGKKSDTGPLILEAEDPLPGSVIGHGIESGTTLPFSWKDSGDVEYWDCPGFRATSGPEQEIVDAFSIYSLCKGPTKIVVAISENNLGDRCSGLLDFFEKIEKAFPQSSDGRFKGFTFILTKKSEVVIDGVLGVLARPHEGVRALKNAGVKDLITYLKNGGHFASFPSPEREGPYPSEYKEGILEVINKTEFVRGRPVNLLISSPMQKLAQSLAQKFNKELHIFLHEDVSKRLMNCCLSNVNQYSNPLKNGKELSLFLEKFKRYLKNINNTDENSFFIELGRIIYDNRKTDETFYLEKDMETLNKVKNGIESIQFLQKIDSDIQFDMYRFRDALQPILSRVAGFCRWPIKFYEAAAEENFPNAYKALGIIHESGTWVEEDILMAIKNYKKAVSNELTPISSDLVPIQYKLGCFYTNGISDGINTIEKNPEEAFFWFEKAAQNGHALSQYNLGLMYEQGIGISQNNPKAFEWYIKAASQNILNAFISLGLLYQSEDKLENSLEWFEKAGREGHKDSQYILGRHNKAEFKYDIAFKWFKKASKKNHFLSQYELALSYLEGKGTTQDVTKALELFKSLEDQSDDLMISIQASLKLGNMYLNGEEVEKSESQAAGYFMKATEKGHAGAKNILQHLTPNS